MFSAFIFANVDFGLFFFGLANAGVQLAAITAVTWLVSGSLIVGKLLGVTAFAAAANALGFKYPPGMSLRHVVVAGAIAGMGLTVALFVAGESCALHRDVEQGLLRLAAHGVRRLWEVLQPVPLTDYGRSRWGGETQRSAGVGRRFTL